MESGFDGSIYFIYLKIKDKTTNEFVTPIPQKYNLSLKEYDVGFLNTGLDCLHVVKPFNFYFLMDRVPIFFFENVIGRYDIFRLSYDI